MAAGHKVAKQPGAKRPSLFTGDIGDPGTIKGGRRHIARHIVKEMVKRLHKILHVEHAGIEKEPQGTGYI